MRTIKTTKDTELLKESGAVSPALLDFLMRELEVIERAFDGLDVERPLDLMQHGYMVLLEPGDNVRDLREIGLHWVDEGLLGSMPEYVEKVALSDGQLVYRIGILYDNDYMMLLYSVVGSHDTEVEAWLDEQSQYGEV